MGVYNYFPTWGVSNFAGWGLGSFATVAALQQLHQSLLRDRGRRSAGSDDRRLRLLAADQRDEHAPGRVGRREHRAGLFGGPRLVQGRRLPARARSDGPGFEANARRGGRARVPCCSASLPSSGTTRPPRSTYAVLTAGPGWNWSTLVGLYPDVDTYTNQLRALEAYVRSNPSSASGAVLCWRTTTWPRATTTRPATRFRASGRSSCPTTSSRRVCEALQEGDGGRGGRASAAPRQPAAAQPGRRRPRRCPRSRQPSPPTSPPPSAPAPAQAAGGRTTSRATAEPPPPPPASLVGVWKAQASPDVSIALTLEAGRQFAWEVDTKGQKQTLSGIAGFKDNTLALLQQEGPPLVGKVTEDGANKFVFAPDGAGDKAPGLTFTR